MPDLRSANWANGPFPFKQRRRRCTTATDDASLTFWRRAGRKEEDRQSRGWFFFFYPDRRRMAKMNEAVCIFHAPTHTLWRRETKTETKRGGKIVIKITPVSLSDTYDGCATRWVNQSLKKTPRKKSQYDFAHEVDVAFFFNIRGDTKGLSNKQTWFRSSPKKGVL